MNVYILIALTAIFWGGWPVLARLSNTDATANAPILIGFSLLSTLYYFFVHGTPNAMQSITASSMSYLIPAGIMLGGGMVTYSLTLQSVELDLSSSVPMVNSGMLVVTVICSIALFGDNITPQKVIGFVAVILGIYLLRP